MTSTGSDPTPADAPFRLTTSQRLRLCPAFDPDATEEMLAGLSDPVMRDTMLHDLLELADRAGRGEIQITGFRYVGKDPDASRAAARLSEKSPFPTGAADNSTNDGWPDDSGAPCLRFTGVDAGEWYVLDRSLGDYHPRSSTGWSDLASYFQEDDIGGCDVHGSDDLIGFTDGNSQTEAGTSWDELYPNVAFQDIFWFENGVKKIDGYVSFDAVVDFLLSVSISGPTSLGSGQNGMWSANVSNGTGAYTYSWRKDGTYVGSGSTYSTTGDGNNFSLSVTVTDQGTGAQAYDARNVLGGGCPPPQITCE